MLRGPSRASGQAQLAEARAPQHDNDRKLCHGEEHRSASRTVTNRRGSLLLEAIIAIGVFAIFLGGIGLSLMLGERSTIASGDRARAVFLASQQLEAVREMRQRDFALLSTGTHGVKLTESGWSFSGSSVLQNGYRSSLVISSHAEDWIDIQSQVRWNFGNTRSGSIVLETSITNWQKITPIGNWGAITQTAKVTDSGTPEYRKIAVENGIAYVASLQASGGRGLYVFDVTHPASPQSISSSFDLGASAYGIAVSGNRLYLATDHPTQELQIYDISSPSTLSVSNLLGSVDLPGSGDARSIAVYGNTVFVGMIDHPPFDQFTAIRVSETEPPAILDSLAMSGSVLDIHLHEGYAYIGNASNNAEMLVVDIFDPSSLAFASGIGIDLPDVQDGNTVTVSGTAALLGRSNGATIDELSLYTIADSPVPAPPPGPWTLEIGGDINALAAIGGSKYAFVGGSSDTKQLCVLDIVTMALGGAPILKIIDTGETIYGLFYNWQQNRLYAVSPSSLFVFSPG